MRLGIILVLVHAASALATPPPNIVIEKFEFLPAFTEVGSVQIVDVNANGDFCGYIPGLPPREFRCFAGLPMVGSFDVTWEAMNDAGQCVGNSFQIFPPFGIRATGPFGLQTIPGLGFFDINNKGWTVGKRFAAFGAEPRVRIDDLGETELPAGIFWSRIDEEGRSWGIQFFGESGHVIRKTRLQDPEDLGTFGGGSAQVNFINRNGDFGGAVAQGDGPSEVFAVVGDNEIHVSTQTGNNAFLLAVAVDGQLIGTDLGMCDPTCDGLVWVVKDGVRHNLDNEISAFLGFFPTLWNAKAASETGWIVGQATDPRDNSFHLYRMKIQVDLDSDGDGLLDFWESPDGGIDFNHDNIIDFKPYDHGARPDHKDLFVEVDSGSFPLSDAETSKVLFAFDNAPVDNPDGTTGIHLHIERDETGCGFPDPVVSIDNFPNGHAAFKEAHFGTPNERQDPNHANILGAKAIAYRYCVLYDGLEFPGPKQRFNGTSEIGGNDFIVDFAATVFHDGFRDEDDRAATFMHELGHTLGLRHGGHGDAIEFGSIVDFMGKPNYPSIMNYALAHPYPFSARFWTLDYSRERLEDLDETSLDENLGIRSTQYTNYSMPFGVGPAGARSIRLVRLNGKKADFNASGSFQSSVQADLNFLGSHAFIVGTTEASPGQRFSGQDDWHSLQYRVIPDAKEHGHDITFADGCPDPDGIDFLTQSVPIPCDADISGDGLVDDTDFSFFVVAYNELLCDPDDGGGGARGARVLTSASSDCPADLNGDRLVDDADFVLFVAAYNDLLCP